MMTATKTNDVPHEIQVFAYFSSLLSYQATGSKVNPFVVFPLLFFVTSVGFIRHTPLRSLSPNYCYFADVAKHFSFCRTHAFPRFGLCVSDPIHHRVDLNGSVSITVSFPVLLTSRSFPSFLFFNNLISKKKKKKPKSSN